MKSTRAEGGRQFPLSLNEVVLVHFFNLSTEIVRDGLKKEYEPALDRLMYWLHAEFKAHEDFYPRWTEVMNRRFGDPSINDKDRGLRIRDKEMLLSDLLYVHKVNLGGGKGVQFERATEEDYAHVLEGDEEDDGSGYSGTPGSDGTDTT